MSAARREVSSERDRLRLFMIPVTILGAAGLLVAGILWAFAVFADWQAWNEARTRGHEVDYIAYIATGGRWTDEAMAAVPRARWEDLRREPARLGDYVIRQRFWTGDDPVVDTEMAAAIDNLKATIIADQSARWSTPATPWSEAGPSESLPTEDPGPALRALAAWGVAHPLSSVALWSTVDPTVVPASDQVLPQAALMADQVEGVLERFDPRLPLRVVRVVALQDDQPWIHLVTACSPRHWGTLTAQAVTATVTLQVPGAPRWQGCFVLEASVAGGDRASFRLARALGWCWRIPLGSFGGTWR